MFLSSAVAIMVADFMSWLGRPIVALLMVGLCALRDCDFCSVRETGVGNRRCRLRGRHAPRTVCLRSDDAYGFAAIVMLFAIVWTTDVVGYFAGRTIGGPKLLPAVSPKKTWSGAIAGTFAAVLVAVVVATQFGLLNKLAIALLALFLSIASQFGDLFESWVKRQFDAKDASQIIPGHGGVMDRLDGFWAAALAGCVVGLLRGGYAAPARGLLIW